jgi:hypothetical protein
VLLWLCGLSITHVARDLDNTKHPTAALCHFPAVRHWMHLPLRVPEAKRERLQAHIAKTMADGMPFRPLSETVYDTLIWAQGRLFHKRLYSFLNFFKLFYQYYKTRLLREHNNRNQPESNSVEDIQSLMLCAGRKIAGKQQENDGRMSGRWRVFGVL